MCYVLAGDRKLVHMHLQLGQLCGTEMDQIKGEKKGGLGMRAYEKDRRAVQGAEGGRQWVKK